MNYNNLVGVVDTKPMLIDLHGLNKKILSFVIKVKRYRHEDEKRFLEENNEDLYDSIYVSCNDNLAEETLKEVKEGDNIKINGELVSSMFEDQNGIKNYVLQVEAKSISKL